MTHSRAVVLLCAVYLLLAPWTGKWAAKDINGQPIPNQDAPLSQWHIYTTYDSAAACEVVLQGFGADFVKSSPTMIAQVQVIVLAQNRTAQRSGAGAAGEQGETPAAK